MKKSAGILLYRLTNRILEVLIVHPGGPFWEKKDLGAWSIPKGEFTNDENPLDAAVREFREEMGDTVTGDLIPLTPVMQGTAKVIYPFALEQDFDISKIMSNNFTMEWPPKSGMQKEFPEIDIAGWFDFKTSKQKLNQHQSVIIDELAEKLHLGDEQLKSKPLD